MNVGWIGLGKLGLPCALALSYAADVQVHGHDLNLKVHDYLTGAAEYPLKEDGISDLLADHKVQFHEDLATVVDKTDGIVFLAVQTPHNALYGGEAVMPDTRADFDYSYLSEAARTVSAAAVALDKPITLVVISTCLPGSVRRHVLPEVADLVTVVYNPFFIAMGTTISDFLEPEFILIGADEERHIMPLVDLYARMHDLAYGPRIHPMSIESAELTKVAYNTFISLKITFANTLMEICDSIPRADVDSVTAALKHGRQRITSGRYLDAGMGDGGACHPRDNIAMSWLAQELGLSVDPFEFVTRAREAQTGWLADIIATEIDLPVILLGKSYKPESDLTYGSPALLLANMLHDRGVSFEHWDGHVDNDGSLPLESITGMANPAVWVICTRHPEYADLKFPAGSVVLDPFRFLNDPGPGVDYVPIGRGSE